MSFRLGRQTGLPRDVTHSDLPPSRSNGFAEGIVSQSGVQSRAVDNAVNYRFSSYTYNTQAVPQKILAASQRRKYLLIQNNGTVNIYVGFGSQPGLTGDNAVILPPNAGISFDNGICPNNDVYVISSVQCAITVLEGLIA